MEWRDNESKYSSGEALVLGRFTVGSAYYDGATSMGDKKYRATCKLPGIKDVLGNFETMDEAKKKVESAVKFWIDKAGLAEKPAD